MGASQGFCHWADCLSKVDGEALCRHVGEGVFDDAEVDGETPH